MNLKPGTKIQLSRKLKTINKYENIGWYTIQSFQNQMFVLKKEEIGYTDTISVVDLRIKKYRFVLEDGKTVKFDSLPDIKKIEKQERKEERGL